MRETEKDRVKENEREIERGDTEERKEEKGRGERGKRGKKRKGEGDECE